MNNPEIFHRLKISMKCYLSKFRGKQIFKRFKIYELAYFLLNRDISMLRTWIMMFKT